MTADKAIEVIKSKFAGVNSSQTIPLLKKDQFFTATLRKDGIEVDNLRSQKLLPWRVFTETIQLLLKDTTGKGVPKGNAMSGLLGDDHLPYHSIEGYIAMKVYKRTVGTSVFRRVPPIVGVLTWAGLCRSEGGYVVLV